MAMRDYTRRSFATAAGQTQCEDRDGGRVRAVATIGRDRLALEVEAAMERDDHAAVDKLVGGR